MGGRMDLIEGEIQDPITHWYYAHKFSWIKSLVSDELSSSSSLVDVGAGSALFSLELSKIYENLFCVAIDTGYKSEQLQSSTNRFMYSNSKTSTSGDLYLFTDVLEHVEYPEIMLSAYSLDAQIGAKFVITVPAMNILWSGHDVFLKHFKRYNRRELDLVIRNSGLRLISSNYIFVPLFPIAYVFRKLPSSNLPRSQIRKNSKALNFIFLKFLKLDFLFARIFPFGISIIALAEKV
jgi:hypothetical protein